MGSCFKCLKPDPIQEELIGEPQKDHTEKHTHISLDLFTIEKVIGHGATGKVFLVTKKDTGQVYAMKACKKSDLEKRDQTLRMKLEREIMGLVDHPYIVQLRFAFQSSDKVYLVMDFVNGGELFFHLRRAKRFTEEKARFYGAELLLALHYLHSRGIIYRDLKPENILLDSEGHIKLTDFGISKKFFPDQHKAYTICGTPEYLAPEILKESGHDVEVDYWSLGILIYEMLAGQPPFMDKNEEKLFYKIVNEPAVMKPIFSAQACSLLSALLKTDVRPK